MPWIMISMSEYLGPHKFEKAEHIQASGLLLRLVAPLLEAARAAGVKLQKNPATGSLVSGETFGGYRPQSCPIGAPKSAHKAGEAVDVYDPQNELDNWLTDEKLELYRLYRENPGYTKGWVHLTTRAPGSGKRTFIP